jgi:hypothetical protein
MTPAPPPGHRPLSALKGRDLRALGSFRDRLRSALGKAFVSARFLSRRALDVPPEATAPLARGPEAGARAAPGKLAIQPSFEPASELRVLVFVERRDVWVEERVDEAALEVALESGAVVVPFVYTVGEWESPLSIASPLYAEAAFGEDVP